MNLCQIQDLHRLYCRLTGFRLRLDMARERTWFEWAGRGFTATDLGDVIRHLRSEIREGRRNPGALKFSNLIGQPDYFEEDLAMLRAQTMRASAVAERVVRIGGTERRLPDAPPVDTAKRAAEVLNSAAFKEFIDLKKKL